MKTYAMMAAALLVGLSLTAKADDGAGPGKGRKMHRPDRGEILKKFDKDGDGKLSEEERKEARAALEQEHPEAAKHLQELKARFDKDGDGKLSEEEREAAKAFMKEHRGERGGERGGANGEMREKLLKHFDKDGDGKLSEDEKAAAKAARGEFHKKAE